MKYFYTLAIVRKGDQVLLARKARGFGRGVWNGFGGKIEEGETVEAAAIRECQEEGGITPMQLRAQGVLTFHFADLEPAIRVVRVFEVTSFDGEPVSTEEMVDPTWFSYDAIPYASMWADDRFWLPLLLAGKKFSGEFFFNAHNQITEYDLQEREVVTANHLDQR